VQKILLDAWAKRQQIEQINKAGFAQEIKSLESKISALMERISDSTSSVLINQYETNIEKLAQQLKELEDQIQKQSYSESNFAIIQSTVVKHLENPSEMWETKEFYQKRLLLSMYFSRGLVYTRNGGYQTPELPLIVKILTSKHTSKSHLVEMAGVKPASKTRSPSNCSQD
jgi:hypothetical protein